MNVFFQSIATRIVIIMVIIAVLPLVMISYSISHQKKKEVEEIHISHLKVAFKETINTIDTNIRYKKQLMENIADMARIAKALREGRGDETLRLEPSLEAYIVKTISRYNFYDFFIINDTGDVIYTYKKEEDFGKNVNGSLLQKTGLGAAYTQTVSLLESTVIPPRYYFPSKRKASFIMAPVIVDQKLLGTVAVQLNEDTIYELIKHYNGLGQTGEVVAGTLINDGSIVAAIPLKYDPDALAKGRILNKGPYAGGMIQAVHGRYGAGEFLDYRGVEVIAVWGFEPTLGWGIVVKTDKDEVLAGIYRDQRQLFLILVYVIIAIALLIALSTLSVTRPIYALVASIRKFRKEGEFDPRDIDCRGEICYLTAEFNAMAEEIQSYQKDLEEKIDLRTRELRQAKEEIEAISITDQLTGLYNRRHLDAMLEHSRQLYERYHTPFSIAIFDADYFKSVNDGYGHQAGDKVLLTIADILKAHCRTIDIVGRWGGEEFLIIYPNLDEPEALKAAENLRRAIATKCFDIVGWITISGGVSAYQGTINETLKRADDALYLSKKEGRNRVCTIKAET